MSKEIDLGSGTDMVPVSPEYAPEATAVIAEFGS
jgi:hypothetical protein